MYPLFSSSVCSTRPPTYPYPSMSVPPPTMSPIPSNPIPSPLGHSFPPALTHQLVGCYWENAAPATYQTAIPLAVPPPQHLREMELQVEEVQPLATEGPKKRKRSSQGPLEPKKKAKPDDKCNFPSGVPIQIAAAVLYIAQKLGLLSPGSNKWTTTLKAQLYLLFCCFCRCNTETRDLKTIDYILRFYTRQKKYKKLGLSRQKKNIVLQRLDTPPAILWEYEGFGGVFRELYEEAESRKNLLQLIETKNTRVKKNKGEENNKGEKKREKKGEENNKEKCTGEKKKIREELKLLLCDNSTSVFDVQNAILIEEIWKTKNSQAKDLPAEDSRPKDSQAKDPTEDSQGNDLPAEDSQPKDSQAKDLPTEDCQGNDLPAKDSQGRDSQGAAVVSGSETGVPGELPIESAIERLRTLTNDDERQRYGNIIEARLQAYLEDVRHLKGLIPPYSVIVPTQQDQVPTDEDPLKQWVDSPIPPSPSCLFN